MSDPDHFLTRWSRRKLEPSKDGGDTTAPETQQPAEPQPGDAQSQPSAAPVPAKDPAEDPPFDPASLPPIESITAGTDIRDFLKPGVPLSLSRAALRRVWSSDPAIRDFIGLAENQWDFTDGSIPGFGPLDPADVPRLLAQVISSTKDTASSLLEGPSEDLHPTLPEKAKSENRTALDRENASADPGNASIPEEVAQSAPSNALQGDPSHRNKENDAVQNGERDETLTYAHGRHGHGSALPS